jgi:hypothetical protein
MIARDADPAAKGQTIELHIGEAQKLSKTTKLR